MKPALRTKAAGANPATDAVALFPGPKRLPADVERRKVTDEFY